MNKKPLVAAMASCGLLLAACSPSDDPSTVVTGNNPLLDLVPADTPFVMASLTPVSDEVIDSYYARFGPFIEMFQAQMEEMRTELQNAADSSDEDAVALAVIDAVMEEFSGNLSPEGMAGLGLSINSMSAVYGNGLFPVARIGLGDADAFRAMISRVEAKSGQSIPEKDFQGKGYWELSDGSEPMAIYAAILDDHVAMTAAPQSQSANVLPMLLGIETPARSLADTGALEELVAEKNYSGHSVGYMDLSAVVDQMFDEDSTTSRYMSTFPEWNLDDVDPSCEIEAKLVTTFVPRIVAGSTTVSANEIGMRYQVEMQPLLAGQIQNLVSDVPPAGSNDALLNASMSLKVGSLREFLLDKASLMSAAPFQCPQMQDMNRQIQQLATSLNQPMPPFIGNLKGFRASLESVDVENMDPQNISGLLSLEMTSPQMVMGMASMMVPGFEELNIEPGAEPVALPQELMTVVTPDFKAYAVMSKEAIGLAIGEGQQSGLNDFINQKSGSDDIVFSADYDAMLTTKMQMASYQLDDMNLADSSHDDANKAMLEAMEGLAGRNRVEIRFDGDGITIDQNRTFD